MTQFRSQFWPWTIGTALFIGGLYLVKGILLPFIAGLLVAYAMTPAVRRFERWGVPRSLGTAIMIVSFMLSIGLLLFIAIPLVQTELLRLAKNIPQYGERFLAFIQPIINDFSMYVEPKDLEQLRSMASGYLADVISWGINLLAGILTSSLAIANLISLVVITPIVAFYFLRDWNKIIATVNAWIPLKHAQEIRTIIEDIHTTIGGFARGQGTVCLVLALYYSIFLTVVGLQFGFIVGLVIGFISFVPYVGAILGFFLSIGLALAQFTDWFSIGMVASVFVVGQVLEGYILLPNLVGDRIGLHPLWVIFAILTGGVLYGFVGILIALPVAAALGVLVRFALHKYKESPYYLGSRMGKA